MANESIELALSVLEAEKANLSPQQRERLAALTSAGEDVRLEVSGALNKGEYAARLTAEGHQIAVAMGDSLSREKRELAPERVNELVGTLKSRFELPKNMKLRAKIDFVDVDKSLRANPEALFQLQKLEETGGEPQIVGMEGDEYIIEDRSEESPTGRRNLDFDQSLAQAGEFGANMQNPDAYKAMQETGKYDLKTGSWLETDPEYRERTGYAMYGLRGGDVVRVVGVHADRHGPGGGWRASLRVKKA